MFVNAMVNQTHSIYFDVDLAGRLGCWVKNQRNIYKDIMAGKYPNRQSVLTPERIVKLEERELRMLCDRIFLFIKLS